MDLQTVDNWISRAQSCHQQMGASQLIVHIVESGDEIPLNQYQSVCEDTEALSHCHNIIRGSLLKQITVTREER